MKEWPVKLFVTFVLVMVCILSSQAYEYNTLEKEQESIAVTLPTNATSFNDTFILSGGLGSAYTSGTTNTYFVVWSGLGLSTVQNSREIAAPFDFNVTDLYVRKNDGSGVGVNATLWLNGAPTALTCLTGVDVDDNCTSSAVIAVQKGDYLYWESHESAALTPIASKFFTAKGYRVLQGIMIINSTSTTIINNTANYTNVAFLNNSQTFTQNNIFNKNVTVGNLYVGCAELPMDDIQFTDAATLPSGYLPWGTATVSAFRGFPIIVNQTVTSVYITTFGVSVVNCVGADALTNSSCMLGIQFNQSGLLTEVQNFSLIGQRNNFSDLNVNLTLGDSVFVVGYGSLVINSSSQGLSNTGVQFSRKRRCP